MTLFLLPLLLENESTVLHALFPVSVNVKADQSNANFAPGQVRHNEPETPSLDPVLGNISVLFSLQMRIARIYWHDS